MKHLVREVYSRQFAPVYSEDLRELNFFSLKKTIEGSHRPVA